jgi:hypothetical protein
VAASVFPCYPVGSGLQPRSDVAVRKAIMKLRSRHLWFKPLLVSGLLLGLMLLVQSTLSYYQVSRILVNSELRREALQEAASLERSVRRFNIVDLSELSQVVDEIRQDSPKKIAWIRVIDSMGHTLIESGKSAGTPIAQETLRSAIEGHELPSEIQGTATGRVLKTIIPLRFSRRPPPELRQPDMNRAPAQVPRPQLLEIALFWDSASAPFGRLRRDLIISCSTAFGLMASMVLLWFQFPQYVLGKQLEQQMELARQVQKDLCPPANPTFENLDFAAECVSAWQVGGDFYDVFRTGQGSIALLLGDVSGKGLPAAVLMGLILGAVRSSDWASGTGEHEASSQRLSELLLTRTSGGRFASLFWGYYEPAAQIFRYVNAGHLPPMVFRQSRERESERLEEGGPVLGVLPKPVYRQGSIAVSAGDLMVLYSDGVVEAMNASGEEFGEDRLRTAIRENSAESPAVIRDEALKHIRSFLGEEQLQDDLTLVVARIR